MKTKLIGIIICMLLVGTVLPITGTSLIDKTTSSTMSGNTFYVGGDGPGNYSKIQDAIDNASDGDTVFVYDDSSPYNEFITLNKSIHLLGEDKNTTKIDYSKDGYIIVITEDFVTLSNFWIENPHETTNRGIVIYSNNTIISDNIIRKTRHGIKLNAANRNTIRHNNLARDACTGDGICVASGYDNIIEYNTVSGFFSSIELEYCNGGGSNVIRYNTIDGGKNRFGIHLWVCSNIEVYGNNISGCIDSDGAAISTFWDCGFFDIHHNIIKNNFYGIKFEHSTGNIHHNTFMSNTHDATFTCQLRNIFSNNWFGNYWGAPRTLPKLINGVIYIALPGLPFINFPWIKFDWHPAQEPYDIDDDIISRINTYNR